MPSERARRASSTPSRVLPVPLGPDNTTHTAAAPGERARHLVVDEREQIAATGELGR